MFSGWRHAHSATLLPHKKTAGVCVSLSHTAWVCVLSSWPRLVYILVSGLLSHAASLELTVTLTVTLLNPEQLHVQTVNPMSPPRFSQLPLTPSRFPFVPLAFGIFPWHQSCVDSKQAPLLGRLNQKGNSVGMRSYEHYIIPSHFSWLRLLLLFL